MEYESKITPEYGNKAAVSAGKIKDLKFKAAAFRIKNLKGKNDNGQIKLDFLPAKYLQKQNINQKGRNIPFIEPLSACLVC